MKSVMRVGGEILVAALLLLAVNEFANVREAKLSKEPGDLGVPAVILEVVDRPKSWRM